MKLKYKILMAIIAVSIGLCLMIYQSYALWVVTLSGQENIVSVGCFNIEFQENSNSIALSNSYPVSDARGMSGEAYSFTITNKCTVDSAYQVTLNTLNANTMGDDKVKYVIYKDSESKPSTGSLVTSAPINADKGNITVTDLKESYIIASGELKGAAEENGTGESHTYNVYLWIDENAGNEVENTRFEASINIVNASTKIQPTAVETIEALAEANPDQLAYDETVDNNLRYIGANPNNYVSFNNELWRIIGVFNNIDNGSGTKETRLKIIRDESYTTVAWDTNIENNWSGASLQQELNATYLNSIQTPYSEMIGNAIWNLGGVVNYRTALTSDWYSYERGTEVSDGSSATWAGKIGLIYPSDYGYATSGGNTGRDTCLTTELNNWSSVSDCYNNDWIFKENSQWTLTTPTSSRSAFYVHTYGYIGEMTKNSSYAVFPTLYLSSNVKVSDGDGSHDNPFTLSL